MQNKPVPRKAPIKTSVQVFADLKQKLGPTQIESNRKTKLTLSTIMPLEVGQW